MRHIAVALCALVPFAASVTPGHAQQASSSRDCDAGAARRQLSGQPMTEFLTACRSASLNPENLQNICAQGGFVQALGNGAEHLHAGMHEGAGLTP